MESKFNNLQSEIDNIEAWLNEHQEHERYNEGFEKMRQKLVELNAIYCETIKPKQGKLI